MNFNPKYTLNIHESIAGSIPGSGRSPGGRQVNPLQYSCLKNPIDRGAWWATVQGVARIGYDLGTKKRELILKAMKNKG